MNPPLAAATPLAVEQVPPGDPNDEIPAKPWGSPDLAENEKASPSQGRKPARMVGSIVDPSVDDDGLGLKGPGAPGNAFTDPTTSHPVRAQLLAKARSAKDEESETLASALPRAENVDPPSSDDFPSFSEQKAWSSPSPLPTTESPPLAAPISIESLPHQSVGRVPSSLPLPSPLPGTPPPAAVASELDRIARRPLSPSTTSNLSPNMIAILGGLVGLTLISTLGVILGRSETEVSKPASTTSVEPAPVEKKAVVQAKKSLRQKVKGPWRIKDDAGKPGRKVLSGKIGKKAFLTAIQTAGLPKNEAYRAYAALKGLKDLDHCKSTDTFQALVRGSEKSLVAFEYSVNKEEIYQAKLNKEGRLEGAKLDLTVSRNQVRRSFTHDGKSFEESARRAGFDPGIAKLAEGSLRGHSKLSDFKKGDRLRMIAQEVTVLGEFSRYAGIEAMEILRDGEDTRRIYYYPHPVEGGHFDKNGRAPYEGGWRKPVPGAPVTSKFNMTRMHPVLNRVMPHTGTDFGAPAGTPIGATSPGIISFRGPAGASGNLIKVKHDGGYESGYAHLSRFGKFFVGDKVERLQTVGYCGSTGRSTGPHLHFTIKKDGQFIDAQSLNLDGMRVLPKAHRGPFSEVRAKYNPILDQIPLSEAVALSLLDPGAPPAQGIAGMPVAGMPVAGMPTEDEVNDPGMPEALAIKPASPKVAEVAPARRPEPVAAIKPAQATAPSAIFLSDDELLRMQSRTDDGEVSE